MGQRLSSGLWLPSRERVCTWGCFMVPPGDLVKKEVWGETKLPGSKKPLLLGNKECS